MKIRKTEFHILWGGKQNISNKKKTLTDEDFLKLKLEAGIMSKWFGRFVCGSGVTGIGSENKN